MANRHTAVCTFTTLVDGVEILVREGEERADDSPVVKQHPELFGITGDKPKQQRSRKPRDGE